MGTVSSRNEPFTKSTESIKGNKSNETEKRLFDGFFIDIEKEQHGKDNNAAHYGIEIFPKGKTHIRAQKGRRQQGQGKKGIGPKIVLYVRRQMKGFPAAPALDNINEKQYNGKTIENIPHRNGHALRAHGKGQRCKRVPT